MTARTAYQRGAKYKKLPNFQEQDEKKNQREEKAEANAEVGTENGKAARLVRTNNKKERMPITEPTWRDLNYGTYRPSINPLKQ